MYPCKESSSKFYDVHGLSKFMEFVDIGIVTNSSRNETNQIAILAFYVFPVRRGLSMGL